MEYEKIFLVFALSLSFTGFVISSIFKVSPKSKIKEKKIQVKIRAKKPLIKPQAALPTYWVKAGSNGNGSKEGRPAGNITYILNNDDYNLTEGVINVKPGVYNNSIEDFPLNFTECKSTKLNATGIPSTTILKSNGNGTGILVTTLDIKISGFTIKNHRNGLVFSNASSNTISRNCIVQNSQYGVYLRPGSTGNEIYRNNFIENSVSVNDTFGGNSFNNSEIGNYWDDYMGKDKDGNGIGDTLYEVPGKGESVDYLPSMKKLDFTPPSVNIYYPLPGRTFDTRNITVMWIGEDKGTGINHYEIRIDDKEWRGIGKKRNYTFTDLSTGKHTVDLKAVDSNDNIAIDRIIFKVEAVISFWPLFAVTLGTGVGMSIVLIGLVDPSLITGGSYERGIGYFTGIIEAFALGFTISFLFWNVVVAQILTLLGLSFLFITILLPVYRYFFFGYLELDKEEEWTKIIYYVCFATLVSLLLSHVLSWFYLSLWIIFSSLVTVASFPLVRKSEMTNKPARILSFILLAVGLSLKFVNIEFLFRFFNTKVGSLPDALSALGLSGTLLGLGGESTD